MDIKIVELEVPENCNLILGQSHFIKTVEDLYEAIFTLSPKQNLVCICRSLRRLSVRKAGNNKELTKSPPKKCWK
jgi:adenosine/AMP kinase